LVFALNTRGDVLLDDADQVAFAERVVAFPVQVLPVRLSFLFSQLALLLANPRQLRGGERPDRGFGHASRHGDTDPTARRVTIAAIDRLRAAANDTIRPVYELLLTHYQETLQLRDLLEGYVNKE
jgi:hypothetical protein